MTSEGFPFTLTESLLDYLTLKAIWFLQNWAGQEDVVIAVMQKPEIGILC